MKGSIDPSVERLEREILPLAEQAIPGLQAVYLFGSAREDRLRPESDVDLAVLAVNPVDAALLFDTAQVFAGRLGREVDLVDLRRAPLILQAQIVGRGRRLPPCGPATEVDFFENQVLSRYTAFAEERRPLLGEIIKRCAIHAA